MWRKPFASAQLPVMCRLLCSLLMSLAVTDGAFPYLSCTCQHYSQPLENRLLNHQLKQCTDSQSHRLITYCLHNMWCIWALVPKMFSGYATAAATFPPLEDPNPRWHPDTMALPSCPCASIYPQMLQLRTGVCLPNKWKNLLDRDNNADKWNHGTTLPLQISLCLLAVWCKLQS